jgi:hypothetical protein
MSKSILASRKQKKKCSISAVHLMCGTALLAVGFLAFNFAALQNASIISIQEAVVDVAEGHAAVLEKKPLAQKAAQSLPMSAGGPRTDGPQYHIIFSTGCSTFQVSVFILSNYCRTWLARSI